MQTTDRIYLREAEQREFIALVVDVNDDIKVRQAILAKS